MNLLNGRKHILMVYNHFTTYAVFIDFRPNGKTLDLLRDVIKHRRKDFGYEIIS